jgi:hypothetical protein
MKLTVDASKTGTHSWSFAGGQSAPEVMAIGLLADAKNYVAAALAIDDHATGFSPKYFLLCHALELIIKSYNASHGEAAPGCMCAIARARADSASAIRPSTVRAAFSAPTACSSTTRARMLPFVASREACGRDCL